MIMNIDRVFWWVSWNIFLAVIPVLLAQAVYRIATLKDRNLSAKLGIFILGFLWLIFLPNTCYLITEWRHFLHTVDSSNMYMRFQQNPSLLPNLMLYTGFYTCFSAAGMLTFALAIRPIAKIIKSTGAKLWVLGIPLFLLTSLGVYLGLILRYNSWDLITQPQQVLNSITVVLSRPRLAATIVGFSAFLWLAYIALDIWIDGLLVRVKLEPSNSVI